MVRKVERRRVLNFLISKRKQEEKFLKAMEKFLTGVRSDKDEAIAMGAQPWELEDIQKAERETITDMNAAERDIRMYTEAISIVETYLAAEGVL